MNKVTFTLDDKNIITEVAVEGVITAGVFLDSSLALVQIAVESLLTKASEAKDYDEDQSKEDREKIYNLLNLFFSQLANEIYPEHLELGPTPEEFLAKLDEKVKELKEFEQK